MSFKEVSILLQGRLKGVSKKHKGCFKEVSKGFQGRVRDVPFFIEVFRTWRFEEN